MEIENIPMKAYEEITNRAVQRFSSTQEKKINLRGITGFVDVNEIDELAKVLLIAGELVHIGKNNSFGFGKNTIVDPMLG